MLDEEAGVLFEKKIGFAIAARQQATWKINAHPSMANMIGPNN